VRPPSKRFKVLRFLQRAQHGPCRASSIGKYVGAQAEINVVEALAAGDLTQLEIEARDLIRMAELMRQYVGFPLGVADASVITAAERLSVSEVAALDHRHFRAVTRPTSPR
jgi:predicted nucleic acid-binding protein